jgi:GT2 family glycosyltransferase
MTKIKLSIIIVNWNTQALLKQCLDSITGKYHKYHKYHGYHKQGRDELTMEIIVVDNGSTDGSVEYLKKLKIKNLKLKYIFNADNLGFGKANNQGIKVAKGEYIMLLNSDTVVKPGAIEQLVDYLDKNPDTAVSPRLLLPNSQPQNEANFKFPNLWQIIIYHNPVLRFIFKNCKCVQGLLFNSGDKPVYEVDHFPMATVVMVKETWEKVGGLDESYKFFFEDVDWSWRAMQKGIKRVIVSDAEIIHLGGASWKQKLDKNKTLVYRQNFSSMLYFCRKNYSYTKYQLMRWSVVINMVITFKFVLAWYFIKTPTKQTNLW